MKEALLRSESVKAAASASPGAIDILECAELDVEMALGSSQLHRHSTASYGDTA